MYKTVEKVIKRIVKRVEKETGVNIEDFLYDAHYNYEYDDDGRKATVTYIIRGLEHEADMFMDFQKEISQ